jgi:hypothetical protein
MRASAEYNICALRIFGRSSSDPPCMAAWICGLGVDQYAKLLKRQASWWQNGGLGEAFAPRDESGINNKCSAGDDPAHVAILMPRVASQTAALALSCALRV